MQRIWYARRCAADACEREERNDTTTLEFRQDGALARRDHQNPDGSEWITVYEYNDAGQITSTHTGHVSQVYEYDAEGRLLRVIAWSKDANDRVTESYQYDSAGRKKKTFYVDLANQRSNTTYSWGVEGTDIAYSAPGAATLTTSYNERQQPVELLFHDEAGRLLSRVEFRYDPWGNLIEEAQTKQAETLPPEMLAELNPEQRKTLYALFGVDEPLRRLHRYDERGRRVETRWDMGPLGGDCQTMTYNEAGYLIADVSEHQERAYNVNEAGQLSDIPTQQHVSRTEAWFHYEYDLHGNWRKKTGESRAGVEQDFTVFSIEQRTIGYFE